MNVLGQIRMTEIEEIILGATDLTTRQDQITFSAMVLMACELLNSSIGQECGTPLTDFDESLISKCRSQKMDLETLHDAASLIKSLERHSFDAGRPTPTEVAAAILKAARVLLQ